MHLFLSGLKSLEAVEQQVKVAAERQHIDYELSDNENEMDCSEDDDDDDRHVNRDGELSFDYITSEQRVEALPTPQGALNVNADHREENPRRSSHSAPLFPQKKSDLSTNAYVLPTPVDSKSSSIFTQANHSAHLWHSSPLEPIKTAHKDAETNLYSRLPRPTEAAPRHAFSGPVKPSSTRLPVPVQAHSTSPRMLSPAASPPLASSPRITELHELPRPPGQFAPPRRSKSPVLTGHSAPVTAWSQERSNVSVSKNIVASPLPVPPLVVPRSYSIPSRNQSEQQPSLPETNQNRVVSPPPLPLTPASLMNLRSLSRSRVGEAAQSGQIRRGN